MATTSDLSDLAQRFLEDQDPHEDPPAAVPAPRSSDTDEATAEAVPPRAPRRRVPTQPPPRRPKTNTTLHLPAGIARRLRDQARGQGRTLDDVVVSAFLARRDAVAARYVDDADRLRLGLRPRPPVDVAEATTRVAVWISRDALIALDDAAAALVMTRSAYVAELLELSAE